MLWCRIGRDRSDAGQRALGLSQDFSDTVPGVFPRMHILLSDDCDILIYFLVEACGAEFPLVGICTEESVLVRRCSVESPFVRRWPLFVRCFNAELFFVRRCSAESSFMKRCSKCIHMHTHTCIHACTPEIVRKFKRVSGTQMDALTCELN